MPVESVVLIALGSGIGGMARYAVSGLMARYAGHGFPWGTLLVNVSGSFAIGLFFGATGSDQLFLAAPPSHQVLTYGVLGGYTTFSTFSFEMLQLISEGEARRAVLYSCLSVLFGLGAAVAGVMITGR